MRLIKAMKMAALSVVTVAACAIPIILIGWFAAFMGNKYGMLVAVMILCFSAYPFLVGVCLITMDDK